MGRPQTKKDLEEAAQNEYDKLMNLLDDLGDKGIQTRFNFQPSPSRKEAHWTRDKNPRDVVIHLYEWHQLLLAWVKDNKQGQTHPFLPAPYNWRTYGDMNVEIWKKHQTTTYEDGLALLVNSHKDVMALIHEMTNDELFEQEYFPWAKGSTVGSYCVSATSSHYMWASKKLRLHKKTNS